MSYASRSQIETPSEFLLKISKQNMISTSTQPARQTETEELNLKESEPEFGLSKTRLPKNTTIPLPKSDVVPLEPQAELDCYA